ncbi:AAA family ATPase [Pseudomonas fluorescens]|uniref:AAA family ATPase n=1 Tax=Pseudomonas fluorescens TaxID=294 RepID=UPI001930B047|nr:AAA family ATPase [Pseudomonas fluorescens]MBD8089273.1 AAA family ATPase [Pseudomonas fluorescens]
MTQVQKIQPLQTLDSLNLMTSGLIRQEARLLGIAQQAKMDMAHVAVEIAECDRLLNRKDDVLRQLGLLQQQAQAKNKGVFEELLTSLIHEIMPHKKGEQVVLSSTLRQNLAALDIDINSNGNLENISRDKGGSIANIVAMGMRFVVLARQPNRRVLFLDEADCHLREEYIPAFAAVMQQLAQRLGIQVIYISHHPAAFFQGFGRIIEIYKQDGQNHAQTLSDEQVPEGHEYPENAFRYIRLRDFGPHENVLVELGGGLNIITGDNDLGKSKVITAVGELLANDGQEARIRHDRPFFEIEIGLEMGMSLLWKYKRTGSQKTLMELKDKEGQVVESSNLGSGKVPEWLHTYLAMGLVNDKNIHVHHQDEPKYLLSSHYTSIDRAKMLPLGRESRDVLRMIQIFNQQVIEARSKKKGLDAQLMKVRNLLQALSPLLDSDESTDDFESAIDRLKERCNHTARMKIVGGKLNEIQVKKAALENGLSSIERIVLPTVNLSRSHDMQVLSSRMEKTKAVIDCFKDLRLIPKVSTSPVLRDAPGMLRLGVKIKATQDAITALSSLGEIPACAPIQIADRSRMTDLIVRVETTGDKIASRLRDLDNCQKQSKVIKAEKEEIIKALGGTCPTCLQSMNGVHAHV